MREINRHHINQCNRGIIVCTTDVADEVNSLYLISIGGTLHNALEFQQGSTKAHGVNGLTNEALLAVLIDRLEGFQRGPSACEENAMALGALEDAMKLMGARALRCRARGEGWPKQDESE